MLDTKTAGYPSLGRTGLGNMLFPWARCFLWCKDNHYPMVAPIWTKIRFGPYLRKENDKRQYQKYFTNYGYISGIHRLIILCCFSRITENKYVISANGPDRKRRLVVFKGMNGLFSPLMGRNIDILNELLRITKYVSLIDLEKAPFIGIHIRRGDFAEPKDENLIRSGGNNYRIPLEWYKIALFSLRKYLGNHALTFLFTDGSAGEVEDLLSLPNVFLYRRENAVSDLISLSKATIMIGSGSTFSMWASFLGQVPCVWYPGQRRQGLLNSQRNLILEPELEPTTGLPDKFAELILKRWGSFRA